MNLLEFFLKNFALYAKTFLSVFELLLIFFAISTAYSRKCQFVRLRGPIYHIIKLILIYKSLLLLNDDFLIGNLYIGNDYLSYVVKIITCLFAILYIIIIGVDSLKKEESVRNHFEYAVLIFISVLGLLILASANDLITAYLVIELQSIAFYVMAAFKKNSTYSIERSLKYFIISSLASSFFLFGSSILYGCMGTLNFDDFHMFSSILFQNNICSNGYSLVKEIKEVSPSELATIKILSLRLYEKTHSYRISPNCIVDIKTNIIQRIALNSVSNPGFDIFANLFFYLSPFLLLLKTDKTPSTLMDYYIENFAVKNDDPILSLELVNSTNPAFSGGFQEFLKNHMIEKENPLEYWFTLFKSYSKLNDLQYTYFGQFEAKDVNVFTNKPNNFLSYCNSCLDLAIFDKYIFNNTNNLGFDPTILLFKKIYSSYLQMESSFINVHYNFLPIKTNLLFLGFLFICLSIFIKLVVAPFHDWFLNVYEGSTNKITTFFAVVPRIGLFILLTRIWYNRFFFVIIQHCRFKCILFLYVFLF